MDTVLMKKLKVITDSRNGDLTLDILYMAAYLAPGDIRSCLFSQVCPDSSDLKAAIQFLHRMSFVQFSDVTSSFSTSNETRGRLRVHLNFVGLEEEVLKRAIFLLDRLKVVEYYHLLSVYSYAKLYPSIQLGQLAVKTIYCMLREQKFHEACEFGTECKEFLVRDLGEYHRSVMDVQSYMALALVALLKRNEAIAVLTDVYQKSLLMQDEKETAEALFKLAKVVMDDPCNTSTSAEVRLRKIVFHGKTVTESCDDSDLEIWLIYSQVLVRLGMTRKTVSYLDEVIERRRDIFGQDDDGILDAMQAKARCLVVESKLLEAMELSKSIFEKRKKKFGIRNLKTLTSKIDIARILLLKGEFKESMTMFEELVKHSKDIDDNHNLYLTSKTDMVRLLRLQRDFEKALELSTELHDEIVTYHDDSHLLSYDCLHNIGEIFLEMGLFQEARKCFKELLVIAPLEEIDILFAKIQLIEHMDLFNAPAGSLHCAAKEGQISNVLSLLETGQNVEAKDSNGMTALHYASAFGQVQVSVELLARGAKYNSKTPFKTTPLQIAKVDSMKMLLKAVHSFFEAVKEGNIDLVIEQASKEPCVLGARDEHGCTCLHWAALRGFKGILGVLVELGADPMKVTDKGNSPLHIAASKGHVAIAETLLRSLQGPSQVTAALDGKTGTGGNTSLHAAAEKGFPEMVRALLAHGAVHSAKNAVGKTPSQLSEDWGCRNVLGLVEALFLDVGKGDVAALCGKLRGLESEDVLAVSRAKNAGHRTLMQEAVRQKHVDVAQKLVKLLKYNS